MAIKLGDAGTIDHFGLAFQYQIKKIIKKNGQKHSRIKNPIIINAERLIPVPYGKICCTYHPLKLHSSPNSSSAINSHCLLILQQTVLEILTHSQTPLVT